MSAGMDSWFFAYFNSASFEKEMTNGMKWNPGGVSQKQQFEVQPIRIETETYFLQGGFARQFFSMFVAKKNTFPSQI